MALPVYLAMTPGEMTQNRLPAHCAWMACHFSPYGLGLSNLPRILPEGSLLILNDRTPVNGHDPQRIARQLAEVVEAFSISGVLLDFQRPGDPQTAAIAREAADALLCPVAVSEKYAGGLSCAVFLEAPRAYHSLPRLAAKWPGRELWLEAAFSPGCIQVTRSGSRYEPDAAFPDGLPIHREERLCCSYCIQKSDDEVRFFLERSADDLRALLTQAENLGITRAVGLYQELGSDFS